MRSPPQTDSSLDHFPDEIAEMAEVKFQSVFFLNATLLPFLRKNKKQHFGKVIWKTA